MIFEFKLPDIGEGLTEAEVVKWHVKAGDSIQENQPLVNILTDKAEVEIPSPKSGKIVNLFAKEGQKVQVGQPLVSFETSGSETVQKTSAHAPIETNGHAQRPGGQPRVSDDGPSISATPGVRKLAIDLGVNLSGIRGTGPGGRVTEDDVRKASSHTATAAAPAREERVPFSGIRRRTAEKMALSYKTIPHVTHADEADYTALVALREELKAEAGNKKIKLTFLPFIMKAVVKSLQAFPNLNAVLDETGEAIVLKRYYNIGFAVDTEQGLVVPVVKDAGAKGIWDLAADIHHLAEKARANKLDVSDLQGGTFTITNIGPLGGVFATPIILHPEVAILATMKVQERPVVREGKVVVRQIGYLCLAFDHRVLDGAQAAHFTNTLIRHLENPRTLL